MGVERGTALSVNLNKVALLRNQRDVGIPSVTDMARLVIDAGAHGITVHPRPDERHIRRADVFDLRRLLAEEYGGRVEYNIEGNPTPQFVGLVMEIVPTQVTLVPDSPEQRTSDHGWDMAAEGARLEPVIAKLRAAGMRVSLFIDADANWLPAVARAGADRIELYTEPYAAAHARGRGEEALTDYVDCARAAERLGLGVNAGHDLNLQNLPALKRAIPMLSEVSIGHAITADALRMGFPAAVAAYLEALRGSR